MFPLAMFRGKFASMTDLEEAWRHNHALFEQVSVANEAEMMAKIDRGFVVDPKDMVEKPKEAKAKKLDPVPPADKPTDL